MEKCEATHCFLPKGHDGLHLVVARIFDIEEEIKDATRYDCCRDCPSDDSFNGVHTCMLNDMRIHNPSGDIPDECPLKEGE